MTKECMSLKYEEHKRLARPGIRTWLWPFSGVSHLTCSLLAWLLSSEKDDEVLTTQQCGARVVARERCAEKLAAKTDWAAVRKAPVRVAWGVKGSGFRIQRSGSEGLNGTLTNRT